MATTTHTTMHMIDFGIKAERWLAIRADTSSAAADAEVIAAIADFRGVQHPSVEEITLDLIRAAHEYVASPPAPAVDPRVSARAPWAISSTLAHVQGDVFAAGKTCWSVVCTAGHTTMVWSGGADSLACHKCL